MNPHTHDTGTRRRRTARPRSRWAAGAVALTSLAALTTACDSSGGAQNATGGSGLKIIYVRNVPQPTPFDAPIVKGYQDAGRNLGANVIFQGAPGNTKAGDPAQGKRLVQNAVAAKPSCLIVTFDTPSAQGPEVRKAQAAGIPVVFANAGYQEAEKYGALTYIGSDETLQGRSGAQELARLGVKHPLMVSLAPGSLPLTDQRNAGFESGFSGRTTWLYLSLKEAGGTTASIAGTIQAKLARDPSIDAVFTAGVVFAPAALAAHTATGSRASELTWATIDTNEQILGAVKAGKLAFALDQQQYLQGYWAALVCDQYVRYGLKPVDPVMATGPVTVTRRNIADYLKAASEGIH
ncbi:substrate-binding domain-containing protein [Thermomonospora umbrina]|uniref:Monosaccharide ABC transporter substrate-binding protein (CUT2 family) n=1 Tax=Thermomonospora umbrina TaxID=111806 RepID=A0A3D9T335_9ACTN|nr:substrate-binding domain-containing protein [Thermomonospora umbrina]REF00784.1 monosaccharide ABC transporter substrate-binding protein (CUT2 family) [Thermomonospora umbrina]